MSIEATLRHVPTVSSCQKCILSFLAAVYVFFRSRSDTALEILALRQQVAVLKRKRPRPPLNPLDRFFWVALQRLWSRWTDVVVIVKPATVVGCHRAGFRLYWRWRSQPRGFYPSPPNRASTPVPARPPSAPQKKRHECIRKSGQNHAHGPILSRQPLPLNLGHASTAQDQRAEFIN